MLCPDFSNSELTSTINPRILSHFLAALRIDSLTSDNPPLEPLSLDDWKTYFRLAVRQRVAPLLVRQHNAHWQGAAMPTFVAERFERQYCKNVLRNQCLFRELATLLRAFAAEEIPVIVLKGAHLAVTVYDDPAQRLMTDIDLLVPPAFLVKAQACLQQLGYASATAFDPAPYFASKNHLPALRKEGAVAEIELHWNVTFPHQAWSLPPDELWKRAQPFSLADTTALCLCPEDLLLYVCYHATYHHLFELFSHGISSVCDVDRIVRHFGTTLDWDVIAERARRWHWERGVHLQILLAIELLQTPVPQEILHRLQPPGFRREILQSAITHLLADKRAAQWVSRNLAEFWQEPRTRGKLRRFLKSLFPPPVELAARYHLSLRSARLWFYYVVHLTELMQRWAGKVWQLWRGDHALQSLTAHQHLVSKWLEQR